MRNKMLSRVGLILLAILVCGSFAWAQDLKNRMRERLPKIIELKSQGVIGENNRGFLEIRGNGQAHKALIDAENQDRRQVYSAIAKKKRHFNGFGRTTPGHANCRKGQQGGMAPKTGWKMVSKTLTKNFEKIRLRTFGFLGRPVLGADDKHSAPNIRKTLSISYMNFPNRLGQVTV